MSVSVASKMKIDCPPFLDQRPGTSGLRKKVKRFAEPHYLAMFVQAIFEGVGDLKGSTIALGGDGYGGPAKRSCIAGEMGHQGEAFSVSTAAGKLVQSGGDQAAHGIGGDSVVR